MKEKKKYVPGRRILVTIAVYLFVILASLVLCVTHQIAEWVAQVSVALALGRLVWLAAWGAARKDWGWRV